jgi:succinate-semialdehyde dehydrogenase/glutarate-semialdehyde dehydrogenase
MTIESINPATEEVLATFDEHTPAQIEAALAAADAAFRTWSRTTCDDRAPLLRRAAEALRARKAHYAGLIADEMGKPIVEAEAEVEKCAWNCDFFAEEGARFLADEHVPTDGRRSYVAFDPLGPVLAVMPWNFPFWQVFRFAAPALMAGNTAVLKHASNVPQCALAIGDLFRDAGFPHGVFQTLLVPGAAAERLIADSRVRAVTLTGSDATGSDVAAASGRALKKTVLELGGSDPFVVLADADLAAAAETAARARFQNTGQSCIAAKRFIVEEAVAPEFEERFAAAIRTLRVGNPRDRATQVGPLARPDLRDAIERQLAASVAQGAHIALGGARPEGPGYYFAPTLLTNVALTMPVFQEETFGPLAAVLRVPDADAALAVANETAYGLGATLWTRDLARAQALARRVEAGAVFVNGIVASDPRLPFGGIKRSGYGRELSHFGLREFVNIKTVVVAEASGTSAQAPPEPAE